jgi:hypothetical protein
MVADPKKFGIGGIVSPAFGEFRFTAICITTLLTETRRWDGKALTTLPTEDRMLSPMLQIVLIVTPVTNPPTFSSRICTALPTKTGGGDERYGRVFSSHIPSPLGVWSASCSLFIAEGRMR